MLIEEVISALNLSPLPFEKLVKDTEGVISSATEIDYDSGVSYVVEANGFFFSLTAVGLIQIDERYEISPKKKETARRRILGEAFADAGAGKNVVIAMPAYKDFRGGRFLLAKLEN